MHEQSSPPRPEPLLTAAEVAALYRVAPKTVTRWAARGSLPEAFRTPGGHRRWRAADIRARLNLGQQP